MMKNFNTLLIIILTCLGIVVYSQVTTVCATSGNIQLKAGNHQIGILQWEKSYDNTNWEPIHNANSNTYEFLPTESAYYRVANKFAYCEPNYSPVTFVQMKPEAYVGSEKIVNGDFTLLSGNTVPDGISQWTILEGSNGIIENPDKAFTKFSGEPGLYKLKYTLQNSCGTSSQTLTVKFIENQYYHKLVVVDNTDVINSTATEIENGVYKITFSEPAPTVESGTILLGMVNGGFMRKVQSITQDGDVFIMNTVQAKLDEVIQNGGLELGKLYNLSNDLQSDPTGKPASEFFYGYKQLEKLPTREELKNDPKFKNNNYFFVVGDGMKYSKSGITAKSDGSAFGERYFFYNFDNMEIYNQNGVNAKIDGEFRFYPNVKADLETSWLPLEVTNFYITLDNAKLELDTKLTIELSASGETEPYEFNLVTLNKDIIAIIAGYPTWLNFKTDINGTVTLSASANGTFAVEANHKYVVNAGITYKNKTWNNYFSQKYTPELKSNFNANLSANAAIDIGPKITFAINGIEGPYLDLKLTTDTNLCAATENAETFYWGAGLDLGARVIIGLKPRIQLFEKALFDINYPWENRKLYTEKLPYSLGLISGDNQQYTKNTALQSPFKVQVLSKNGRYAPGVFVNFEAVDNSGNLSETTVATNSKGIAEVTFTPTKSEIAFVKAYVKDCDFDYLKYAPITFSAKEIDNTNGCTGTTLSASYLISNNMLKPTAHLGQAPYQYSVNGGAYSDIAPQIPVSDKQNYSIAVKDAAGCVAFVSFTDTPMYNPGSCFNSNLRIVSLEENQNTVTVVATGGSAPYLYSKDGVNYVSSNIFNYLKNGSRKFYVKDNNGCVAFNNTVITGAPILKDPNNYLYDVTNIGTNWWSAENYRYQGFTDAQNTNHGSFYGGDYPVPQIPGGWKIPSRLDFQNLINELGTNAFQVLTSEMGFNAKPHGYFYKPTNGSFTIQRLNQVAVYRSSDIDSYSNWGQGWQTTYRRPYCLVIDYTNQTVSIQTLTEYLYDWSMGRYLYEERGSFNMRLVKIK